MSLRFLLGMLPSGPPDENNQTLHEDLNISGDAGVENTLTVVIHYQNPAKFHIGMLTISLLVGIAYSGYTAYTCWMEKNIFLGYIRNLAIALTCRTFFSLVFDGAILLGTPYDIGGANFLLSIEHICLNLVIAFWLVLNIYLHERVQRNFNNEPTLLIYQLGVPGVAVFFAFVWIFTLQDQWPSTVWWIFVHPFTQWIVNSINLLYLLIQLAILGNIIKMMTKITLDNDGLSLQMKCSAMMGVLVFIFWLQFGLSIGRIPLKTTESYLYFYYLIDGLECALICVVLFFFYKWVLLWSDTVSTLLLLTTRASESNAESLAGGRGIVTIDSMFMTRESGKWQTTAAEEEEEGSKDVVYSNVIGPERLKKTIDLYKRLNIIPTNPVTTVEGEEFYDCQLQSQSKNFESLKPNVSIKQVITDDKSLKVRETKQKKNAFYSSKYLILDSKESEVPKYMETRLSVSSVSGKGSFRDERKTKRCSSELNSTMTQELVQKWLEDVIENKEKKTAQSNKSKERKPKSVNSSPEPEKYQPELSTEDQSSMPKTIFSVINSAVSNVLFGSNTDDKKRIDQAAEALEIHETQPKKKSELSTEKKSELGLAKVLPGETTMPQDAELEQLSEPQVSASEPENIRTNESKFPDDSNFKVEHPVSSDTKKPAVETALQRTETTKPQDAELKQISRPKVHVNEPENIQTNESKFPDDSNFKVEHPVSSDTKKPAVETALHRTETTKLQDAELKQVSELQVRVTDTEIPAAETLTPKKDENVKPATTEPHQKDHLELEVNENEISVSSNQHPSVQYESCNLEKDKTPGESLNEFKHKPELAISDKPNGLEVLENDLSLFHTVNELQFKPKSKNEESQSEKSSNQNITYSDLLEFRSQRDKSATDQQTGISKKLFDISEALTSTIGSLINASSNFFTTRKEHSDSEKDNEHVISEIEKKEI